MVTDNSWTQASKMRWEAHSLECDQIAPKAQMLLLKGADEIDSLLRTIERLHNDSITGGQSMPINKKCFGDKTGKHENCGSCGYVVGLECALRTAERSFLTIIAMTDDQMAHQCALETVRICQVGNKETRDEQ